MKLTSQQNLALRHKDGPILVLAGPGAGKTTMLLERIKFLSTTIDPKHILTITFSKTQAVDMMDRYKSSRTNFMTIHAFCYLIIRNYLKKNNRNLRLLESDDLYNKYDLIKKIYFKINNKKISKEDLNEFFRLTSYMKNAMLDETYLEDSKVKNSLQIYRAYENFKIRNFYIDFDDMQVMALKLIQNDQRLLNSIRNKYKYIQVDEGQDTSLIQFKIIEKIAAPLNNLMIVADDDQSIYSFRASDVSYLLNLKSIYPDLKIIEMTENHRSSKNIVNISKAFIDTNQNRYPKDLFTNNDFSGKITIRSLRNVRDEYKYIIENIKKGKKNAILFRNNIQALNIISFLMEDEIDFSVNITRLNFFESKIIDDLFNIIEFSDDFDRFDLFCEIYYKIGTFLKKKEVDRLSHKALNKNVFEALYDMDLEDYKIETLIQKEKQLKHIRKLSLDKKISYIYKYMDYKSYISNFSKKYREEVVNKDLFVESMVNFTKNLESIEDFYNKKEKLEKKLSSSNADLILSSIHKSKGLEYDNVFVINMVKNEFPIIVDNEDIVNKIEEERRVMYVAMTRAKKNLHILTIKKRGSEKLSPSIFYNQIKDLI
ncbi:ATP-dependent helicase [Anaerococcus sp.]|uniref:ATP-dependent helicase n=1 Tax=Anaerococcus sp. TaxID=1872515 RepID=UPI002A751F2C|nr:ATP-dependent helicase [Anaerococcus sp.]MDD6918750.1 ATP-dependent helicase [Peptoniphilaceae bacterium]MDY2928205.1 ATP-dependent helicase [Anaerococcus sp.]